MLIAKQDIPSEKLVDNGIVPRRVRVGGAPHVEDTVKVVRRHPHEYDVALEVKRAAIGGERNSSFEEDLVVFHALAVVEGDVEVVDIQLGFVVREQRLH